MSEYQYYEFRAVDRPLTRKQMDEVRKHSTRAEITSTSFINEYHWGDFRGDVHHFIEHYFDAMVYVANWGTHQFLFRVPADVVHPAMLKPYLNKAKIKGGNMIIDLTSQSEDDDDFEPGNEWMSSLISVRAEIISGDFRPLYIAWLARADSGELDDDDVEPPVPAGLKTLTAVQVDLAGFLRVSDDLLAAAAQKSPDKEARNEHLEFSAWLKALPAHEKDELLISLAVDPDAYLPTRLRQRFRKEWPIKPNAVEPGRTVAQLLEERDRAEAIREAAEAEAAARKRAEKQAKAMRERSAHLDGVAKRGDTPWQEVESLVATKQPANYDSAVSILKDLRDLSIREGTAAQFAMRVFLLTERHAKKTSFCQRVAKAQVITPTPKAV